MTAADPTFPGFPSEPPQSATAPRCQRCTAPMTYDQRLTRRPHPGRNELYVFSRYVCACGEELDVLGKP